MKIRQLCAALSAALAFPLSALAADSAAETTIKLVQEQLHHRGFYSGLIDGKLMGDTQAALAQFQLSQNLPVSGSLDARTLAELGVEPVTEPEAAVQHAEAEPSAAAGGSPPAAQ